jgi:hypothetical protein
MIRGFINLVYRDRKGSWRAVIVSPDGSSRKGDQLRLMLAGAALDWLGKGPSGPAWWVAIGPAGIEAEPSQSGSPAAITEAIRKWHEPDAEPGSSR